VRNIFKDMESHKEIKEFLLKIEDSLRESNEEREFKLKVEEEDEEGEIVWSSPLNYNRKKYKPKVPQKSEEEHHQPGAGEEEEGDERATAAKSTFAYYFLQKINTMGLLNKVVSSNLSRISKRTSNKASFFNPGYEPLNPSEV